MEDLLDIEISRAVVLSYEGDFDEQTGLYAGFGEAMFGNGGSYQGQFRRGLFHGKGEYIWKDTSKFEGDFDNGAMTGKGVFTWANSSKYEGGVKNGKRHGTGQYTSADGQVYSGDWLNGMRHGKGKMFYGAEKNVLYVGTWVCGLRDGYGTMRYASGNTYEGEWSQDKKCGRGVMVWKDVDEMYLGLWRDDQPHGYGEYIWADSAAKPSLKRCMCNMYRGNWVEGRRAGMGTFFYSDGSQYTGEWADNQKDGSGVYCHADGRLHFGFYAQDRMLLDEALPKESDAVAPQIKIHIGDLLESVCPGDAEYAISATKTIERLLLRYNSTIRAVCKRYIEFGNAKRKNLIDTPPEEWSRLDKLTYSTRSIFKRLQTSTLGDFWRFCREFSITGPHFTTFDVATCLSEMQANRRLVARDAQRAQERESAQRSIEAELAVLVPPVLVKVASKTTKAGKTKTPPTKPPSKKTEAVVVPVSQQTPPPPVRSILPLKALTAACVEDLLVPALMASESPLAQDPRYPLREYEFVELFVRCAVRSHLNEAIARGSKGSFGETMDVVDENGQMSTVARTQLSGMPGHNSTMSNLRTGTVKPRNGTDLAEIVYSALAEKLHAVTSDWNLIPALAGDIYSSSVQQLFTKHATTAKQIFDSLKSDLTPPSLRTVLSYVLSLKAPTADFATPVIAADCGLLKLLDIVAASLVHSDPSVTLSNMTKLDNRFMLEDFLELLCKLVLSEVWVHGSVKQPVIEDAEPTSIDGGADGAAVDELALTTSDIKIVTPSQTIIEKLTLWFEDYRKPVEGTVPDV